MSLVCGVIRHPRRIALDKASWSWPFGRFELQADRLRAYTPVFFGRFQLHIPYSDIAGATTKRLKFGGRIRLRPRDGSGDLTIVTLNDGYLQIRDVLRRRESTSRTSRAANPRRRRKLHALAVAPRVPPPRSAQSLA